MSEWEAFGNTDFVLAFDSFSVFVFVFGLDFLVFHHKIEEFLGESCLHIGADSILCGSFSTFVLYL